MTAGWGCASRIGGVRRAGEDKEAAERQDAARRQRSEVLSEPVGEDPVGVDLQDVQRLLDQG